jgi:hypothetical protein
MSTATIQPSLYNITYLLLQWQLTLWAGNKSYALRKFIVIFPSVFILYTVVYPNASSYKSYPHYVSYFEQEPIHRICAGWSLRVLGKFIYLSCRPVDTVCLETLCSNEALYVCGKILPYFVLKP